MKSTKHFALLVGSACLAAMPALSPAEAAEGQVRIQWEFSSNANPAVPEVSLGAGPGAVATISPGEFSTGYIANNAVLGDDVGLWDLGASGSVMLHQPGGLVPAAAGERTLCITTRQFSDGGIYLGSAAVAVPGATLIDREEIQLPTDPSAFGSMIEDKTYWSLPDGVSPETATVTGVASGSIIASVTVEATIPIADPVTLAIRFLPGQPDQVELSWPSGATGYSLETSSDLNAPADWSSVEATPETVGVRARILLPAGGTAQFYRLIKSE